jgi:hypothetical protein
MKVYNINTTAWQEENLKLLTDLSIEEITLIIKPFVDHERLEDIPYDNNDLLNALLIAYPDRIIEELTETDITI